MNKFGAINQESAIKMCKAPYKFRCLVRNGVIQSYKDGKYRMFLLGEVLPYIKKINEEYYEAERLKATGYVTASGAVRETGRPTSTVHYWMTRGKLSSVVCGSNRGNFSHG